MKFIIANLKTKKSIGVDEISPFFVCKLASVLSPYMCFYFPLHSNLEFFQLVLKSLGLFQSIRQDPKMKLLTTAQHRYLPVYPKF